MAKLSIIGLDGVNWNILERAMEKGKMPYFESILSKGADAKLETTQPPLTGPAWTCIMTGQNPGRHGIFGFVNHVKNSPYSATDIRTETIYEKISETGDVAVVNLPLSYPPRFDGEYVGSFMSPEEDFVRPDSLRERFDFTEYKRSLSGIEKSTSVIKSGKKTAKSKRRLIDSVLDDQDLFFLLFSAPDWIMHNYYHRMKKGEPERAFEAFKIIDDAIRIADSRSDNLMLLSDHGFKDFKGAFHVNQWLRDKGYLETEGNMMDSQWAGNRLVEAAINAVGKFEPVRKLAREVYLFSEDYLPFSENVKVRMSSMVSEGIDMQSSRAFCPSSDVSGIFVNDERFKGVVENSDELVGEILDQLPDKVPAKRAEEIYEGEDLEEAPDIIIIQEDYKTSKGIYGEVFSGRSINHHGKYGFFFSKGENFSEKELEEVSLYQIAPTVAELFELDFESDEPAIPIVESSLEIELLPDDF